MIVERDSLAKQTARVVGEGNVLADEAATAYAVDGIPPKVVVFPGSVEEVSEVMKLASQEQLAVTPWGGGTAMGLGGVPERLDLVVSLHRLSHVIEHEPADLTAGVQAGIRLRDFQAFLGQKGQFLSLDPPHPEQATVGGILAANQSGPRRLRYGSARDVLIGIRVVQADGKVVKGGAKVVKNVTGYDMNKLFIGSLGTLGIIVEAIFRLYPLPAAERTYLAEFPTLDAARGAVARVLDFPVVPSALELLNPLAGRLIAEEARIGRPLERYVLATSVESVAEAVDAQLETIKKICQEEGSTGGNHLDGEHHESLWRAIRDFPSGSGSQGFSVTLKASVLLSRVADALRVGEEASADQGLDCATVSEAGSGIIKFYLRDEMASERFSQRVAEVVEKLRAWTLGSGGSLVVLDAPPVVKARVDVWGPVGKTFSLMQGLKAQFDPSRILNPGRFVGKL